MMLIAGTVPIKDMPLTTHSNFIVGMERMEDAGIYKLTDTGTIHPKKVLGWLIG